MSTTENPTIFTKARVSNIMAAAAIGTALYMFAAGSIADVAEASLISVIVGFAARHLWDSAQS